MEAKSDEFYMQEALKEAELAYQEDEVPVGAVIVFNGEIIARGHNHRENQLDIASHAEIEAIRQAEAKLGRWKLEGCTLYTNVEPCLMCLGAILQSNLFRIVYGSDDPVLGSIISNGSVLESFKKVSSPLVSRGVGKEESASIMKRFFQAKRK